MKNKQWDKLTTEECKQFTVKNKKRILSCFETADLLKELIDRQEKEQLTPKWEKIDDEYNFYED